MSRLPQGSAATGAPARYGVALLGDVGILRDGRPVASAPGAERLVAYLGCRGAAPRETIGEELWPGLPDGRGRANLRSALWRLQRGCPGLVVGYGPQRLTLDDSVVLDLARATAVARALIDPAARPVELPVPAPPDEALLLLDVLPDWYDDWAVVERERYRQLRLHALERLALAHLARARHAQAIEIAGQAVCAEPLRESGYRILVRAHQDEGNHVEARRVYERCRDLMEAELGLAPTAEMERLAAVSLGRATVP
ncbi:BTAD domain-containing putative transcriptional regulator [Streptomyces sp. NPDC093568]|uniref:AfsR/SARP family transcriptional regulator n=1 Tax=Streptomyces sp. NPDC093568 TaxID=3366041 RepID=UPI003815955C